MRVGNTAKVLLFVAAVSLLCAKAAMAITLQAALPPQFPAGYSNPGEAQATAQELHIHHGESMAYAAQSGLTTASDCVSCNPAAAAEECPDHCECLTEGEAAEQGWTLCNGERILCYVSSGFAAAPVEKYCYQAAAGGECPNHCVCLPVVDGEAAGYRLCDGMVIECASDTRAEHRCYEVVCPDGCECVTEALAKERVYPGLCHRVPLLCGYDDYGNPEYCYVTAEADEPVVCREEDISLRQVRLESGQIRCIVDAGCPIARVQMMVDGTMVRECSGRYCEYTGGPYPPRAPPDFSAVVFDHLDEQIVTPSFEIPEIVVTMPEDVAIGEYDPCPLCPDPEPGWGECLSHTCNGNDHFQAYDWTSNVRLTGCFYEDYALTGGMPIDLGEGLIVEIEVAEPIFDYCVDGNDIVLHRCRNDFVSRYTYTCPYGCYNGMCICATSDGGINPYERGWVLYGTDDYVPGAMDYCIDEKTLREYYTEIDHENNTCTIKWIEFECPGVCRAGACDGTCFDGIQNQGELGIDCGGPCLAACEHHVGWYPQNYGFTFDNPGGRKLSYGSCWSTSSSCSRGSGDYKGTFGNCSVCICKCFGCCCGWRVRAGLYYPIYRYGGASAGQCLGMSLSSLAFYYGDRDVHAYDPLAAEVKHLEYTGTLRDHIASGQGKTVSEENIHHYLFHSSYWGANDVLNKVDDALGNDPPHYGVLFIIEDNGWGGPGGGLRRAPLGHAMVAANVVYVDGDTARIYVYDPDMPVAEHPTPESPYFDIDNSPYVEIHKPSNTYTYYGPNPNRPATDWDGQLWTNSNNEQFDRIGYMPYSKLGGNVNIPRLWDAATALILGVLGSADAQVEDGDGRILGFSEDGPDAPTIENGLILPVFGEPVPGIPTTFALPMDDYKLNIRGTASGNYSAYIMGDSPHIFAISEAEVSAGTTDTISIEFGAPDEAELSFSTSDAEKRYSLQIASLSEEDGDVIETLYTIKDSTISSGSKASFAVDPASHSLLYTNYGDTAVTYSVQIYRATIPAEGMTQGTVQPMATHQGETDQNSTAIRAGTLMATGIGADRSPAQSASNTAGELAVIIDDIQVTGVYTFTIDPMERHFVSPEDWSDLPASQIHITRTSVAPTNWPLIGVIIAIVLLIGLPSFFLLRRRWSVSRPGA